MKKIKFQISSYDERRELCAILADNGYKVMIKKLPENVQSWNKKHYVIVEVEK